MTYGAPSNGIFGVPDCLETVDNYDLCEFVRQILAAAVYDPDMQVMLLFLSRVVTFRIESHIFAWIRIGCIFHHPLSLAPLKYICERP